MRASIGDRKERVRNDMTEDDAAGARVRPITSYIWPNCLIDAALLNMHERVLIKRYSNSRLYNTETGAFVSLADLADMLVSRQRIIVQDAETGEDITSEILDLLNDR